MSATSAQLGFLKLNMQLVVSQSDPSQPSGERRKIITLSNLREDLTPLELKQLAFALSDLIQGTVVDFIRVSYDGVY